MKQRKGSHSWSILTGKEKKMLCDRQDKLFAETSYLPWKWKAEDF